MKIWPIKNKVIQLAGKISGKQNIDRMERDREIARLISLIHHEIDMNLEMTGRQLKKQVLEILRTELK
jgi:hypothetical protein